jgi:adiponectin receptor
MSATPTTPYPPERNVEPKQIANALEAVSKSASGLISIHDLPKNWQYNFHIINGYRFTRLRIHCIRSIFQIHNETFNIWSHLLGCFFLLGTLIYGGAPVPARDISNAEDGSKAAPILLDTVYYAYLLAAVVCTASSVSWHTMRCIASHSTMSCFSSLDLMGVTTLTVASVILTQCVAFVNSPFYQYVYMAASVTLGAVALTACWLPIMCRPEASWARISVWIALGLQGTVVPITHLVLTRGWQETIEIYGPIMPAYGPIVLGAIIYASQFPECWWPGRFDYIGASHNILHLLALWAIWLGIGALRNASQSIHS